ncbi:MptD family putative ECF transporter S component [Pseudoramibacter faecis]|uniref:MptD family putative ECF transporter S component n=1 Tax=Pseudoramibacter faecis TaxID=3108534 RepID=UPI002E75C370|nr:MptD family putative ECF transporter S component [Pseudoramibacter sp. HA2172]
MNTGTNHSGKLTGKDLINIGIFTAVFLAVTILVSCTLGLIPLGYLALSMVVPIIGGIPMMLFYAKIKKFGMLLIFEIIFGLVMIFTGMGFYLLIWGIVTGLIAELIMKAGKYSNANLCVLSYAVLSISVSGNYVNQLTASSEWVAERMATYGEAYMNATQGYLRIWWVYPLFVAFCFAGGLIGGFLGKAIFKKHFKRSGLI